MLRSAPKPPNANIERPECGIYGTVSRRLRSINRPKDANHGHGASTTIMFELWTARRGPAPRYLQPPGSARMRSGRGADVEAERRQNSAPARRRHQIDWAVRCAAQAARPATALRLSSDRAAPHKNGLRASYTGRAHPLLCARTLSTTKVRCAKIGRQIFRWCRVRRRQSRPSAGPRPRIASRSSLVQPARAP